MQNKSIKELIISSTLQDYPMSKGVFIAHLISLSAASICGCLLLIHTPLFFWIWCGLSAMGLVSLCMVRSAKTAYNKYFRFCIHYLIVYLTNTLILIYNCIYPSIFLFIYGLFLIRRLWIFISFGVDRYRAWKKALKINDLYYYQELELALEDDRKNFINPKSYIVNSIIQIVMAILYFLMVLCLGWNCGMGLLFLTRSIQSENHHHLPIYILRMRLIKGIEK